MTGKGFAAGDFLSAGLRRSEDTPTSTRVPVNPSPPPPRQRYARATYYLRPDQVAWARQAAREVSGDGSVSASDIARVGLDLAAALPPAELRRRVIDAAAREGQSFPGRHNRGMPA